MMLATRLRRWSALLLCALAGGCLVESLPEEPSRLELAVGLPPGRSPGAVFNPWDSQGLFHLELWPKYLRVAVEARDFTLASGTWPDPQRGIGEGEQLNGEVSVELEVPAGANRRLRALGFVISADEVVVYREETPLELDLVAGKTSEASLRMVTHPVGMVEMTVRCQSGNTSAWPTEVALVDATAFVIHPPRQLKSNQLGSLQAVFTAVPVGRPHWVRVTATNGKMYGLIDLRQPTFTATAGEKRLVEVVVDCSSI